MTLSSLAAFSQSSYISVLFYTATSFALCPSSLALVRIKPLPPVSVRVSQEPGAVSEGLTEEQHGPVKGHSGTRNRRMPV